ncbi:putative signaling protein [BD1-7 clade bacterium]|uniref:Putative signaling protein n=1 Tax=BD1-7 clade bacterium TaxID=2029982 RepID=A0A5S9Q582_9GAMM|nr:putative signaling protein [BD1-7 clade bacterium]CAA0112151.1 putative signaling protein [BD1-7 clade bacterium]
MFIQSQPFGWLNQIIDYFIHKNRYVNPIDLYRARILVGSLLTVALSSLVICLFLLSQYFKEPHAEIGMLLTAGLTILYGLNLAIFKNYGSITVIAHSCVAPLYIALMFSAIVSGGPLATSSQILFLLPVLTYFTAGGRAGLIWFSIVLVSQLAIYGIYWRGYRFISLMTDSQYIEQSLVHWLSTLVGLIGITAAYESANQRLIAQREAEGENNRYLSQHDLLTGLKNRAFFAQQITRRLFEGDFFKQHFSLYLIDIKAFKQINQAHSYGTGDRILVEFSQRLARLAGDHPIARMDGNTFAMAMPVNKDMNDTPERICEMILASATQPFSVENTVVSPSVAIGFSLYPDNGNSFETLLEKAETALMQAKSSPYCCCGFDEIEPNTGSQVST